MFNCRFLAIFGAMIFPTLGAVEAATFGAYARVGTCEDNPVSTSSPAIASCSLPVSGPNISVTGTAFASAGDGSLAAEATSWGFRDIDFINRFTGSAQGFASFSDVISISGVSSGTLIMPLDLEGMVAGSGGSISGGVSLGGVSKLSFSGTEVGIVSRVVDARTAFSDNSFISIVASLNAEARSCSIFTEAPQSCVSQVDYGSSLRFLGITVLDESGNDVTTRVTVTSQSGFDYVRGAEPHNETAVIPLPASAILLLSGLIFLGARPRRQSLP